MKESNVLYANDTRIIITDRNELNFETDLKKYNHLV
jgi:hypothetical protein